jgi:hypothetical protein
MRAVEAIIAEFFRSVRVTIDREARISADRDAVDPGPILGRPRAGRRAGCAFRLRNSANIFLRNFPGNNGLLTKGP